jgi:hypothetical protein
VADCHAGTHALSERWAIFRLTQVCRGGFPWDWFTAPAAGWPNGRERPRVL